MKNQFLLAVALLATCISLTSCKDHGKEEEVFSAPEGSIYLDSTSYSLTFPEDVVNMDSTAGVISNRCVGPRPAPQGCGKICKPCFFFICKNGEWTRVRASYPDRLCRPRQGDPVNVCHRTPSGWCPPECHMCI